MSLSSLFSLPKEEIRKMSLSTVSFILVEEYNKSRKDSKHTE